MDPSNLALVALEVFTSVFIALNPIGTVPVFIALTGGVSEEERKKMVLRATILVICILTIFAVGGYTILELLGVNFYSFKVAGGILLLILGVQFVFSSDGSEDTDATDDAKQSSRKKAKDISVFPLGIPLLAGPAVITTTIIQMERVSGHYVASGVVILTIWAVILTSFFILSASGKVAKLLGPGGVNIATRVVGILLASMACEFWIEGLQQSGLFSNGILS